MNPDRHVERGIRCLLLSLFCILVSVLIAVGWRTYLFMGLLNGQTPAVLAGAYHVMMTGNATMATQNLYWKSAARQTDIILGTVRHQLDPAYQGGLAMTIANLNQSVIDFSTVLHSTNTLLVNTDRSLNDHDRGVLTALGLTLISVRDQVNGLSGPIDASTTAMQALNRLLADPNLPKTLAHFEAGTGQFAAAGVQVNQILYDLQHPERPGPFVRALQITLQLFGITAKMGQSGLPPFNGR